ncbi:MAG: sigma-54-dependent Fis family transcriptional regulator [bacterium]|nr:sigma-54-dependent Fis family transcriptional regulator [bacterium]
MRPTKLSSQVFLELPPVLSHYVDTERNTWFESDPSKGRLTLLDRPGVFVELEAMAVERRQLLKILGFDRARALRFRTGFEQGRRDAVRHYNTYAENARLALQAGPVFEQLQGRYRAEQVHFEFDLEARTLHREVVIQNSAEALTHRMAHDGEEQTVCWATAGYLSGHISEIVGRRVITMEQDCIARGDEVCRFVSRLDAEWGAEADWCRDALQMTPVEVELQQKDERATQAAKNARLARGELTRLHRRMRSDFRVDDLVAEAECMRPVMLRAKQIAGSEVPVLVTGEPGTGRETLARAVHLEGKRKNNGFEVVDCVGMPDNLLVQELTGFVKDAFPGAMRDHAGALVRAHRGTVYFNEVTRLSLEAQGILLRVLEESVVNPKGAESPAKTDVRVIAATEFDPAEKVAAGELREDLFYALAVGRLDLPPLRDRELDIHRLTEFFLDEFRDRYDRKQVVLSDEVKRILLDCAWPGNIRQLRNVIEHAVVLGQDRELTVADLPEDILTMRAAHAPRELTEDVIRAALRKTHNNRSHAAEMLGVGRTTLWRMMKKMGIE